MPGTELEPAADTTPKRELRIPGRDLAVDAARATAGETFTEADYELMERGVAPKTRKTLREAWARVLRFTGGYGYFECPMPEATCVKMIDWCWTQPGIGGQPYSPSTVEGMLWAVTKAHKLARRPDGTRGYVSPVGSEEAMRAFSGYRKKFAAGKYRRRMATPIAPEEQVAMIRTCDTRSVIGLRDALAIALLYDGGFRAGELVVPKEFSEETGRRGIEFEHVEIHVQGGVDWEQVDWRRPADIVLRTEADDGDVARLDHLVVHVPQSKTDQEGYGDEVILPAHPERYAFNCPVRLYIAWTKLLRELGHERRGTVLRIIAGGGPEPADGRPKKGTVTEKPLGYGILAIIFKRRVERAGLEDQTGRWRNFVLHGMRAGGAEASAERGADTPELNRHYRWSQFGTTAQRYAARGLKRRNNPAARVWGGKA